MQFHVRSSVRVRPLLPCDRFDEIVCVNTLPHTKQVILGGQRCFSVDYALPVNCTQSEVFDESVKPMISYMIQGCDISVIAYGQKGSGKTYTILGPGLHCAFSETEYGIIPRATREIFYNLMHQTARKFRVKVTFIEVYEETVRDLLNISNFKEELIILEDKHGSLFISGLEEIECQTVSEVFNWLHIGMSNKQVSCVTLQGRSNHCHSVFTLSLEQEWIANGGVHHLHSKAQFIDLAGSEHLILPICLDQTWRQERSFDFPNTQSLLTSILKNSFGGTANTLVVCCVSPASLDFDETMKTLHFSIHVRNIINVLTMNQYNNEAVAKEQPQKQQIRDDPNIFQEPKMDTFGLEFAASQWLKLASNAGELLTKLSNKENISNEEREEIEHWLCLKQECEEVLGSENDIFVKPFERRTLNRIDEMTESEDQTSDERAHYETSNDSDTSVQQIGESLSESDLDFQPDFLDKLDKFIQTFKRKTDANIENIRDDYYLKDNQLHSSIIPTITTKRKPLENIVEVEGEEENERKNESLNKISLVKYSGSLDAGRKLILEDKNLDISKSYANFTYSPKENKSPLPIKKTINTEKKEDTIHVIEQEKVLLASMDSSALPKPLIKLQMLSAENEAKQYQIRQVLIDLDSAHKRIEELQNTIQIKEKFIDDLISNSNMRATAKERCQRKSNKLEEEYYKTRTNLAQAENALLLNVHDSDPDKEKLKYKQEIEKYKKITVHYEKRLKDIEFIKQIAGNSAKKVLELENSLQTSKRQLEELTKQLKEEENHKQTLERELLEDQKKIKELEEKYNLHETKLLEKSVEKEIKEEKLRWIQEEEERLVNMRESFQHIKEQLQQQQTMLDKREAFLKEKMCLEKSKTKSQMEMSARISHLEQVLKEKSIDLEKTENVDEKEALRHEIQNLRRTRDCLVDQRCNLDEKFQKEKVLNTLEERRLLECDEAIEAIDAAIEYKNELICGRKGKGLDNNLVQREKCEEMLLARLMTLSSIEVRTLLYKYFQKVIDLRENGKKMEMQLAELDHHTETQAWKIQAMGNALKQVNLETERRIITLQREHEAKLHLMLRHFAEETSSSSGVEGVSRSHFILDSYAEVGKYKRENKNLKKRIQELEAIIQMACHSQKKIDSSSSVQIPQQNLKRLQISSTPSTIKVTRQKNKLIIQQQKKS